MATVTETKTVQYLEWEMITRVNTRSVQYNKSTLLRCLSDMGCEVEQTSSPMIIRVRRRLDAGASPREVRTQIENAVRVRVHARVPKIFKGITSIDEEN